MGLKKSKRRPRKHHEADYVRDPETGRKYVDTCMFQIPLSPHRIAVLTLPRDLTALEVRKLKRIIETIRIPTAIEMRREAEAQQHG